MFDRILVEVPEETKSSSGLILSTSKDSSSFKKGVVVGVGPGVISPTDKDTKGYITIPLCVKVDDYILFNYGELVLIDGKNYFLIKEGDVAMIFDK